MHGWYVVYTKPGAEQIAAEAIRERGVETYLPLFRKRRSHAGRVDYVSTPVFSRYMFAADECSSIPVRSAHGVVNLLRGADGYPAVIRDEVIVKLRKREDRTGHIENPDLVLSVFRSNERLRINSGSFEGSEGTFERMTGMERAQILVRFLHRAMTVTVPVASLERM